MFVADDGNHRIRIVDKDGAVTTLAGSDTAEHVDGKGAGASFKKVNGLAFDKATKSLYVSDETQIRRVTADGTVTTIAGTSAGYKDGKGCEAKFGRLEGIVYFGGFLFAVDTNRIRKIEL